MKKQIIMTCLIFAAFGAHAGVGVKVHRPIICNPVNGESTCMTDVAMLDDITLAELTNAPDSDVADAVEFIRGIKPDKERGWNANSPRITILGLAGAMSLPTRSIVVERRADVAKYNNYLLPLMRLQAGVDAAGKGVQLAPLVNDDRIRVSDTYTDVCATNGKRQFCARIEGVGKSNSPTSMFKAAGFENNLVELFQPHSPSIGSADWDKMFFSFEVEVISRKPLAINGARYVRVRAVKMVVHNLDVILSAKLGPSSPVAAK